jgi:dTMP kinase
MFGLVQSLMRVDLLLVTAAAPFAAGAIDERTLEVGPLLVDVNGISIVLLSGAVLGVVVGVMSYRQMDDRPGVKLRTDLARRLRRTPAGPTYSGTFLALEGGEGAGKSTQLWLLERGHEVVVTREPGATASGARIRALLLDSTTTLAPRAEAMLYAADRAQHVSEVVRPALERGAVVVTDRYVDSSLAYQGAGRELEVGEVARLSRWATEGLRPDLVVLLDIDPAVGLARAGEEPDRIEAESLAFHSRVREGFVELAESDPDRYLVIPADQSVAAVQEAVRRRVAELFPAPVPSQGVTRV